jgi:YHS domain-containing protein
MSASKSAINYPVCAMAVNTATAIHAERGGKSFIFLAATAGKRFVHPAGAKLGQVKSAVGVLRMACGVWGRDFRERPWRVATSGIPSADSSLTIEALAMTKHTHGWMHGWT